MTNYWPISNGQMFDTVGAAHMTQGSSTYFTSDRFGNLYSALALNGGWTQVPPGIYFNTREFTISVWILPQQIGNWERVIDFGTGHSSNNIVLALSSYTVNNPALVIFSGSGPAAYVLSSKNLTLGRWQFLTATFDSLNASIYLNGTLTADYSYPYSLTSVTRSDCFVGKSNWAAAHGDGFSNSYLDDLRFYNKSLTQSEIIQLMNQNSISKKKFCLPLLVIDFKF